MLHETIRTAPLREPCFEPPPRLVPRERRLTVLAARALAGGGSTHAFRDNAITLIVGADDVVRAAAVGSAIATAFGLAPGPLAGPPESLAVVLRTALDRARASGAVTPFEAAVATPWAACVLLRSVVLPTTAGADAVLSWKQVLDEDATTRIRAELLREMLPAPHRASRVDAFD